MKIKKPSIALVELNGDQVKAFVRPEHFYFWNVATNGSWERNTFKVFDRFLDIGKDFIDVGSWIGPTVLYAASRSRRVFAIEPNPVAMGDLKLNLALNNFTQDKVLTYPVCINGSSGMVRLGSDSNGLDSMSTILSAVKKNFWDVPAITLREFVSSIDCNDLSLVKIDIEGAEVEVIRDSRSLLEELGVPIWLSLHGALYDRPHDAVGAILDGLSMYKYIYVEASNGLVLADRGSGLTEHLIQGFPSILASNELF
jgi:FkbM family methyltransferase